MKAGGIDSNDKAVLNITVAKIFIADLRKFGLCEYNKAYSFGLWFCNTMLIWEEHRKIVSCDLFSLNLFVRAGDFFWLCENHVKFSQELKY